jgi:aminoglycoside phosphotransferase (APT) family kinase protein
LLSYTADEIKTVLSTILGTEDFTLKPVGNHHLKRHLVYQININNSSKYIFKLYYRDRRRSREIASLKLLENSNIRCPKIFKYGNLEDGNEWLITEYIEGEILDKVMSEMSNEDKLSIFEQMGEELGKLHAFKTFNFFGEWDEHNNSIHNIKNYYEHFVQGVERSIEEVLSQNLPDKDLLASAINQIRNNYKLFDINVIPRLTHGDFDGRNILVKKDISEYRLSGIIDFEVCYPDNIEKDFIGLYYKYFLGNQHVEREFLKGYKKYLDIDSNFHDRLYIQLLCFVIGNCSWAYMQARDYYEDNIIFLKKILK